MEEIVWKTTIRKQEVEIRAETKASTRKDQAVKLIHVQFDRYVVSYVVKIVNKALRSREANNFNSVVMSKQDSGITFLVNEISIRSQFSHQGLCSLFAVRDADQFTFLFEELCDLGVAMTSEEESFRRDSITIPLLSIVEKSGHSIVEAPSSGVTTMKPSNPTVFSEAEACYIMWHLFNTVRDLHNCQICHLDIRPDNIFLTSAGEVKLGGLSFITNFSHDIFGGLRTNFPTRKDFLPPEYWQGGRISCYAVDIWSAVVTLYILVTGTNPFPIRRLDFHMETMSHYSTLPAMTGLSEELVQLLSSCMSPRLTQRLTINQILGSKWFEKYGYDVNKIQMRNSVTLEEPYDTSEMAIPTKWTEDSMIPLSNVIDSCFCKIMDVMYGGVEFEDSVTLQPTSEVNNEFVSVPSQEAIRLLSTKNLHDSEMNPVGCSLPKQGILQFRENGSCWCCWSNMEVYVERGKMILGGLRKRNSRIFSVLDIQNIIFTEDPCIFKIQWKDGNLYSFKADSKDEAQNWYQAIHLSIHLY